jgi:hypothetical protein
MVTTPTSGPRVGRGPGSRREFPGRFVRGRRRRWALASLISFWLALLALALPFSVHADTNSLVSYGATASGWAIQPYVLNDAFLNVPAAGQSAPYVFVSMDNTPGAQAKASYFFPGTAVNAVPNTQGMAVSVPDGVEARYPGNGTASGQVGGFNDGVATQASAGTQSVQASEGYALAQSAIASYQFAPTVPNVPTTPPGVPPLPSPPPVPTLPGGGNLTATPGSGGHPTATPRSNATPTPTPCFLNLCLDSSSGSNGHPATRQLAARSQQAIGPVQLPDAVERQLTAALKAAQLGNPDLLKLAGGHPAATDPTLPYASADAASQAVARATDSGVVVTVFTRAQHVQLLQGLITFASVETTLQAVAPASHAHGNGTITTQVTGATIAGIPVTITNKGVTVKGQGASLDQIQALSDQLNAALAKAGVHVALSKTVTKADVGFWEGAGAGLEVTAALSPTQTGLPSPASGVPGTKVDFSIARVSASIYATAQASSSGGEGGLCFYCGGFGGGGGGIPGTSTPSSTKRGGPLSLLGGLSGGELLALVFVVQGVSTAAVAATAGYTDAVSKAAKAAIEEESM